MSSRCLPRSQYQIRSAASHIKFSRRLQGRYYSSQNPPASRHSSTRRSAFVLSVLVGAGCLYATLSPRKIYAEAAPVPAEVKFEEKRRKSSSKEDNRDILSSQHLQVRRSWENPGVYAWGSNIDRVAAPDLEDPVIKTPRRISFFDGRVLRDLKLDKSFGVAVTENGDLLQWGAGYSKEITEPTPTLKGKNITKIAISRDRIIALSKNGTVYSIPVSRVAQVAGVKPRESTWIPFWSAKSPINYRLMRPRNLSWTEKVSDISSGLEHCLLLTTSGRVFSAVSSSEDFPSKGQLGIPGLTWTTRPNGPLDQPHEIFTLKGFNITKIATGDYHSLVCDNMGRVFSFGDNSLGQLGFETSVEASSIDTPSLLPISKLYAGTYQSPKVTNIAAGGSNSFFTIDATRIAGQEEELNNNDNDPNSSSSSFRILGKITADTYACGLGLWGGLGTGRWTHIQDEPSKIKSLSGLFEYDEYARKTIPIRLSYLSVGATHAAAVMDNVTEVSATEKWGASENETNWGADVVFWGANDTFQLGTGKRNNAASPIYIAPLDAEAEKEREAGRGQEHRFQITPRKKIKAGGRSVNVEQRVECGRNVTAVYSAPSS